MPKRSREEAITTDINTDNNDDIPPPPSKKQKLTSLNDEDEPQEDGTELQMDGWNFDKTTFESSENKNNEKTKKNDDKNNIDGKENNGTSDFSAFTGMGFERSISNNTSPDKIIKTNNKHTSSKNQYVSDDDENNNNENGVNENEQTDFEKSWTAFENENTNENNNGEISWKWDDNTTGTSEFNWSWNDDKDKQNENETTIDPSLENNDTNSSWNFDFNSNSKSNVEWGTQVDEDTIEPIAELNGENKEKGDENDKTLYSIKVKVYAFKKGEIKLNNSDETNKDNNIIKWRECGQGTLKINQYINAKDNNNNDKQNISGRILCRRDNIHTVILNEPIVKEPDDWYKLLKDTRVQFGVVKKNENENNKENNSIPDINDNPNNTNKKKSKEEIVPYFVKPLNGGSQAAKALLNWIKVAQNCVKTQTPYKERSNNNSNVNTDNIDDDDI